MTQFCQQKPRSSATRMADIGTLPIRRRDIWDTSSSEVDDELSKMTSHSASATFVEVTWLKLFSSTSGISLTWNPLVGALPGETHIAPVTGT